MFIVKTIGNEKEWLDEYKADGEGNIAGVHVTKSGKRLNVYIPAKSIISVMEVDQENRDDS